MDHVMLGEDETILDGAENNGGSSGTPSLSKVTGDKNVAEMA
jgi:hypothetical protein